MSTSSRDTSSFDVVGEQLDRHATVVGHPAHADAAQHQRRPDAGSQVAGALLDDADHFAADVAEPQHRYADWAFRHRSIGLPHFQTEQIVDRLPAQNQAGLPVAHGHHGGAADQVVTARHGVAVRARGGDAEQVARV